MNKVIHLSLARKSVPVYFDVVQATTAPAIDFIIDDWTPPASARARIYIKKDGGEIYNNCTLSGNVVTYTPTAGSFDVVGECYAQLELLQSTTVAVSWPMVVTVAPNYITGSAAPASTEFGALTALIQSAQQYDEVILGNNLVGANGHQGWTGLTSGTDLNDVKNVGYYYAVSSIVSSLLNCPARGYFKMRVEVSASNVAYLKQTITYGGNILSYGVPAQEIECIRMYNGSQWSEWFTMPIRSEVNAMANQGAKNLLRNDSDTLTHRGVTFTRNVDGSVTANGTAAGGVANYYFVNRTSNPLYLKAGTYFLTGCPEGGSLQTYYIAYGRGDSSSTAGRETGGGLIITEANASNNYGVWIVIAENVTVENLTFYPMIRYSSIQDDSYVPYGMSNAELTDVSRSRSLASADLNNCVEDGRYVSVSSSQTATVTNKPTGLSNGFTLIVYSKFVNATQVIYESGLSPVIYIRSRTSGGWGAWKKTTLEDA